MGCVMCTPLDDVCNMSSLRPRRRRTMELSEFPQASNHGYQKFIYLPSIREELLPVNEDGGVDYGTS